MYIYLIYLSEESTLTTAITTTTAARRTPIRFHTTAICITYIVPSPTSIISISIHCIHVFLQVLHLLDLILPLSDSIPQVYILHF